MSSLSGFKTAWCHNPEDHNLNTDHCEHLKSCIWQRLVCTGNDVCTRGAQIPGARLLGKINFVLCHLIFLGP